MRDRTIESQKMRSTDLISSSMTNVRLIKQQQQEMAVLEQKSRAEEEEDHLNNKTSDSRHSNQIAKRLETDGDDSTPEAKIDLPRTRDSIDDGELDVLSADYAIHD